MKRTKKTILTILLILTTLTFGTFAAAEYSTQNDPLVSLSYVNDVLGPQIAASILEKIDSQYVKVGDISLPSAQYQYITLNKDSTLMAKGVCEIVVLSGNATVIVTSSSNVEEGQGLIDTTDGLVITNGNLIKANHHVIIPKADGRGIVALSTVTLLVRGEYTVAD